MTMSVKAPVGNETSPLRWLHVACVVAGIMLCPSIVLAQALEFEPPLTDFRDVRRPNDITIGPDLGGTGHQALNFTGSAGAAGDTWITVYDPAPNPPPVTFGSVHLSADVLIHPFNNKKGAGLLALYNEAASTKGLALTLYSAGNTDTLVLATVDQAGKLVTLKTVNLGAAIAENVWYRVSMEVTVDGGLRERRRDRVQARDADRPRQPAHHAGGGDAHLLRHTRGRRPGRRRSDGRSRHSVRRDQRRKWFERDQHSHRAARRR